MAAFDEDIFNKIVKITRQAKGDILALTVDFNAKTNNGFSNDGVKLITPKKTFDFLSPIDSGVNPVTDRMLSKELAWTTKPAYTSDNPVPIHIVNRPQVFALSEADFVALTGSLGYAGYLSVIGAMAPEYNANRTYTEDLSSTTFTRQQTVFVNLSKFKPKGKGGDVSFQVVLPATPGHVTTKGSDVWLVQSNFNFDFSNPPAPTLIPFYLQIPTGEAPFLIPKLQNHFQFFTFTLKTQSLFQQIPGTDVNNTLGATSFYSSFRKVRNFPLDSQNQLTNTDWVDHLAFNDNLPVSAGETYTVTVTFPSLKLSFSSTNPNTVPIETG